ncbi:hypothetical protein [Marinimicrobium locisalis]|uniref:LuxE/PaaK family acyltransferase n=1 Tax=Marinimicrobium locisalis TaxID=546022 RepID=UPI00322176E3
MSEKLCVDTLMSELKNIYENKPETWDLTAALIKESLRYHAQHNEQYASYLDNARETVEEGELANIPLVPSTLFKNPAAKVLSGPQSEIQQYSRSSGTQGAVSLVPRDETSILRFIGGMSASMPALLGVDRMGNHVGIVLGKDADSAENLWFSYALACITIEIETEFMETKDGFDIDKTLDTIGKLKASGRDLIIVGPPFRALDLAEAYAERVGKALGGKDFIITAGGWKGEKSKAIDNKTFRRVVCKSFGLKSDKQIRDCYNMVECNTAFFECEHHEKHIPPWVYAYSVDPVNQNKKTDGEGVICLLDASANSYPCFIKTDDVGIINHEQCSCGRHGPTIRITRRINKVESRGCALKMAVGKNTDNANRFHQSIYRTPASHPLLKGAGSDNE